MLSSVAILLILGTNWAECFEPCEVTLSKLNTGKNMDTYLLWRRTDLKMYLTCALLCYMDPVCASVQVSTSSSTCLAFKDGLWLRSSADNGKLHFLTCRETTTHLKPKCLAAKRYTYHTDTSQPMCFRMHKMKVTWDNARARCHKEGTELIDLNNPEKLEAIRQFISTTKKSRWDTLETWVGLTKDGTRKGDMAYRWVGTNLTYTGKWAPKQPRKYDCGGLGLQGLVVNQCQVQWRFLCEIK